MSHQYQTKSIIEGELISSYLNEKSLITEAIIEEITSNISENTSSRSHSRHQRCICIPCTDGPFRGEQRCGKNGKCTECRCPGGLPKPTSPPDDIS